MHRLRVAAILNPKEELIARVYQLKRQSLVDFWQKSGEDVTGVLWSCNMAGMVTETCRCLHVRNMPCATCLVSSVWDIAMTF